MSLCELCTSNDECELKQHLGTTTENQSFNNIWIGDGVVIQPEQFDDSGHMICSGGELFDQDGTLVEQLDNIEEAKKRVFMRGLANIPPQERRNIAQYKPNSLD